MLIQKIAKIILIVCFSFVFKTHISAKQRFEYTAKIDGGKEILQYNDINITNKTVFMSYFSNFRCNLHFMFDTKGNVYPKKQNNRRKCVTSYPSFGPNQISGGMIFPDDYKAISGNTYYYFRIFKIIGEEVQEPLDFSKPLSSYKYFRFKVSKERLKEEREYVATKILTFHIGKKHKISNAKFVSWPDIPKATQVSIRKYVIPYCHKMGAHPNIDKLVKQMEELEKL